MFSHLYQILSQVLVILLLLLLLHLHHLLQLDVNPESADLLENGGRLGHQHQHQHQHQIQIQPLILLLQNSHLTMNSI
jgi:hypothetical protein